MVELCEPPPEDEYAMESCCWANMGLFNCTCCAGQLQEHIKEKGIIVSTFAGQDKVQIGAIVATGVYEQLFKITI